MRGTFTSRAPWYSQDGISNGGANEVEPTAGGGNVLGSFLGGNWKRDPSADNN